MFSFMPIRCKDASAVSQTNTDADTLKLTTETSGAIDINRLIVSEGDCSLRINSSYTSSSTQFGLFRLMFTLLKRKQYAENSESSVAT